MYVKWNAPIDALRGADAFIGLLQSTKSDDVIKMKFLKLWDLWGYSETTMSQGAYLPEMSISGQIVSEMLAG